MTMTSNQPAVVDDAAFAVRRTIWIAAPIEKVWSAVTEPAHISCWLGRTAFEGSGVGANGTVSWDDRGAVPLRVEAMDAPRLISYRWSNDDSLALLPDRVDDEHSTVFTLTLDEERGGTRLTVVETGFETTSDPAANMTSHRRGWDRELDELVALLTGAP